MGTCIICGVDVDGYVCSSHEEDVCFEFVGTAPDQLTPGRFYRGSVDGFADFGVFIDIGDRVTGLLHRSELDRRLESLDWDPGDTVFVQVKNVRDNGDVDLGWSIRQHESEFRNALIDDPDGDRLPDDEERPDTSQSTDASPEPAPVDRESDGTTDSSADEEASNDGGAAESDDAGAEEPEEIAADGAVTARGSEEEQSSGAVTEEPALERTTIDALGDLVGRPVRIEARVIEVRQTSGPTIFEVRDETGSVECAAFESAGVRAYPEIDAGDAVRIDGEVEERRGDLQVETETMTALEGDDREAFDRRLEEALDERARPDEVDLLADHPAVEAVHDDLLDAATAIRRAVFDARPVVVRHNATVDGYVAASTLERALLPLVREEHEEADAEYHYVDRRPLDGRIYDMDDAMRDTTAFLDAEERHGESVPLFVFVDAGSTEESRDSFEFLEQYGADRVVIDGGYPDESMVDAVKVFVSPYGTDDGDGDDAESVNTTALSANVAVAANPDVREDLHHLPAVSYWRDAPEVYFDLAAEAGYDEEGTATLREALALEAFYQSFEDKRELIADLLFGDRDLATHAAGQFRERLDRELRTAEPHVEEWSVDGAKLHTIDLDAFTHRFEFPPPDVLLAELADRTGGDVVLGIEEDRLLVWSDRRVDVRAVGDAIAEEVPDAGVEVRGGRDGHLGFLMGEREAVVAAAVGTVASQLE